MGFATPTMRLARAHYELVVAHCLDGLPDEACGLFAGPLAQNDDGGRGDGLSTEPTGEITAVYLTTNADASARTYTVDSRELIKAMRDAEKAGGALVGVFHSHTHTDAYPSSTDVRQATYPEWIYALVSLKHPEPVLRAYRIRDGEIAEVAVEITG
ncbi:MAG: M67 family metallopeptidase [Acidimicrobiia bacterium]|nr:M67 family metallopeptidase [Acidimicrobiia bacterium]